MKSGLSTGSHERNRTGEMLLTLMAVVAAKAYAQTSPSPYTTGYRYDSASRLAGTILPDPDGAGPIHYGAIRNTYSPTLGVITRIEKGELSQWEDQTVLPATWGANFTVFEQTDLTYDIYGRKLTEQVSGVVNNVATPYTLTQYTYDTIGRVQCVAVRMNPAVYGSLPSSACTPSTQGSQGPDRITQTTYFVTSRPLQIQKGVGTSAAINYATYAYYPGATYYDPKGFAVSTVGPQQSITDADGNLSYYSYDPYLRLQYLYFPSKNSAGQYDSADYEKYGYDLNGNRTSLQKRDATVISYTPDALNRIILKHYSANGTDVYYGYDLRNLEIYARFGSVTGLGITTTYDGFGHIYQSSNTTSATTLTLTYGYDADGDRTLITHPDGNYFTYGYDGLDRVNLIQENGSSTLVSIVYNSHGDPWTVTRGGTAGNGVATTTLSYDPIDRLQSLAHDLDGSTTTNDVTFTLSYLPSSQILTRNISNGEYAYTNAPVSTVYIANGLNQYGTTVGSASVNPAYDANGNMTFDGATTYYYDAENRLTSTTGAYTAAIAYDPRGRLQSTSGSGGLTQFLYDDDELIAEYNSSGALLRRYVNGVATNTPLVWYEGAAVGSSTRRYHYADHQGSVVAVTDGTGATIQTDVYDEYGTPSNNNQGRFQYTGQVSIPEVGLYYYRARYYSPKLGRFLQTDPIGYKDDLNLYTYVGNDPLDRTDPSGLKCQRTDGRPTCTFDEFRDNRGKIISREQATSGGSKLTKWLKLDPASRVARQEAAMTEKYKGALALEERGGSVTVSGNKSLGVQDQLISGGKIVSAMESTPLVSTGKSGPSSVDLAGTVKVGTTGQVLRIEFYGNGEGASDFGQLFGHEELHAAYEHPSATDAGWDTPGQKFKEGHQVPFNNAADNIK